MSLTNLRPYLRSVMNSLGYSEWTDGFNWENIPSTIIDGTYHLEVQENSSAKQNQYDIEIEIPVVIRLFTKGFRDPASGIDDMISKIEGIIKEACKPTASLGSLVSCKFRTMAVEPFIVSNDNLIMGRIEFSNILILAPN